MFENWERSSESFRCQTRCCRESLGRCKKLLNMFHRRFCLCFCHLFFSQACGGIIAGLVWKLSHWPSNVYHCQCSLILSSVKLHHLERNNQFGISLVMIPLVTGAGKMVSGVRVCEIFIKARCRRHSYYWREDRKKVFRGVMTYENPSRAVLRPRHKLPCNSDGLYVILTSLSTVWPGPSLGSCWQLQVTTELHFVVTVGPDPAQTG